MCLPIDILKCIVSIEAWLVMLGGIAAFIATMLMQIHYSLMLQANSGESWMLFGQGLLTAFWLFSSYIILNGVFGIVGGRYKKPCLLLMFNIGNILILLCFTILCAIGYVMADVTTSLDNSNKCIDDRSELLTLNTESEELLCSIECPCYLNQTNVTLPNNQNKWATNDSTKPTRVQDCLLFRDTSNTTVKFFANYEGQIQESTGCTGWCNPYPLMIFYDINKPVKEQNKYCQKVAVERLADMGTMMGDVGVAVVCLMLCLITITFCLCCHPNNRNEGDIYKRMTTY